MIQQLNAVVTDLSTAAALPCQRHLSCIWLFKLSRIQGRLASQRPALGVVSLWRACVPDMQGLALIPWSVASPLGHSQRRRRFYPFPGMSQKVICTVQQRLCILVVAAPLSYLGHAERTSKYRPVANVTLDIYMVCVTCVLQHRLHCTAMHCMCSRESSPLTRTA